MSSTPRRLAPFIFFLLALTGCATGIPKDALLISSDTMERRQLQTRRFDTSDEMKLLTAGMGVLQDLGFNIDETEPKLGVLVGSKTRDATDAGQILSKVLLSVLVGGAAGNMPVDRIQHIRASIVTHATGPDTTALRVTFQRIVMGDDNRVTRTESLEDPELYREFFEKLSTAVFLSAHEI